MVENLIIAKDIAEAVALKNANSAFLAGGTEVNRLNSSVDVPNLISIGRIGSLDGISIVDDPRKDECSSHRKPNSKSNNKFIRIGSMCTFQELVDSSEIPVWLKNACHFMASRTKRNMATIGGNVALIRDDSYLYPTLLATGALLELVDTNGNTFFRCTKKYLNEHDVFKDCLIAAVLIPQTAVVSSKRYANTAESHAVLTMSACNINGELRIAVALKGTGVFLMTNLAQMISNGASEDEVLSSVKKCDTFKVVSDLLYGSEEYKRYLVGITAFDLAKEVLSVNDNAQNDNTQNDNAQESKATASKGDC